MQTLPRSEMKCKEDRLLTDFVGIFHHKIWAFQRWKNNY